jgi:hypothetical protein
MMQAKAIVGGPLVSFRFFPELARVRRAKPYLEKC